MVGDDELGVVLLQGSRRPSGNFIVKNKVSWFATPSNRNYYKRVASTCKRKTILLLLIFACKANEKRRDSNY